MTVLERFKLELANKEYFTDAEYTTLLQENNLTYTSTYDKTVMQRDLLLAVLDVLNMLTNDIDLFRKLEDSTTGFSQSSAYKLLQQRINALQQRIDTIPLPQEELSSVSMFFTRGR